MKLKFIIYTFDSKTKELSGKSTFVLKKGISFERADELLSLEMKKPFYKNAVFEKNWTRP